MTYGRYVGCMTGTSVDGLDLALIEVSQPKNSDLAREAISILNAQTIPLPEKLRDALLACGQPDQSSVDLLGECDRQRDEVAAKLGVKISDSGDAATWRPL